MHRNTLLLQCKKCSTLHRCFQPAPLKYKKSSFCNPATFAPAFADYLLLLVQGRSADPGVTLCSFDVPMLRAHGNASLPVASDCLLEHHLLLPFQLLQLAIIVHISDVVKLLCIKSSLVR
jgi:hypothetical protein